ncbi:helix-turn-helix domain-containing protein [Mesorhizobium sp. NBSH29]|uniref:helix-turn-helix domain-containing protein n=1 Tax=Mesorhizobium sp. NBSH29 TaxID=2654249 RepID=UPI001896A261|nr:helix-turn-helix domain-containing protein [Mesorhizobium sp. NBSH29]
MLVALLRREGQSPLLPALLAACAVQGVIISLAQHYEIGAFRNIQPVSATIIPALAWISFQGTAIRGPRWRLDIWHAIGPLFVLFCLINAPAWLDVSIPILYVGYGSAILLISMQGPDALPRLRLGTGDAPTKIWCIMGLCLIGSAFSDILIVAAQLAGLSAWQPWIISLFSTGILILLGALALSDSLIDPDQSVPLSPVQIDTQLDNDLMMRLDQLMATQRLYLNADLTLTQLARRLHVPIKQLSIAINRKTGENVSRYINAHRINAACESLRTGESVTSAMLSAGFNTKSNYNREFLRKMKMPPSDWIRLNERVHETT